MYFPKGTSNEVYECANPEEYLPLLFHIRAALSSGELSGEKLERLRAVEAKLAEPPPESEWGAIKAEVEKQIGKPVPPSRRVDKARGSFAERCKFPR
jgi:hypothetical protein